MRRLLAALPVCLALAGLAAPAAADSDTPEGGTLVLNDPAGGTPHSYALSTFQMGVNRPTAAKNDSDSRPDITVVITDARALDPFILQWVASPGGSAAPSLRATITAEITAPSGPKTPLHCDIDGAQVTMFNMGFQDGSAQVVLSLTAAHLKLNGTQLY